MIRPNDGKPPMLDPVPPQRIEPLEHEADAERDSTYGCVRLHNPDLFEAVVQLGSLVSIKTGDLDLGARVEQCAMGLVRRALQSR